MSLLRSLQDYYSINYKKWRFSPGYAKVSSRASVLNTCIFTIMNFIGLSISSFFMVLIRKSDVSHRSKAIKVIGVSERDCPMVTRYSNRVMCHDGSVIRLFYHSFEYVSVLPCGRNTPRRPECFWDDISAQPLIDFPLQNSTQVTRIAWPGIPLSRLFPGEWHRP